MAKDNDTKKGSKIPSNVNVVVTGGGSGGHTMTAITVIEELVKRWPDSKDYLTGEHCPGIKDRIIYIGGSLTMEGESGKVSLEERLAKEKGLKFVRIRSGKLQRRISFKTLLLLCGVVGGIIDSVKFFSQHKVAFVFSTGGYVTVPVCFVAWLKRIPVVIHEQTSRVGLSNKISSYFSRKVLTGFTSANKYFPKNKTLFTGNTIRKIFFDPWNDKYCPKIMKGKLEIFKQNSKKYPVVLICGGGQGSHLINTNVRLALKSLLGSFQLLLITGDNRVYRDYARIMQSVKKLSPDRQERIFVTKFAGDEMGAFFDLADLFVGRSGAAFVNEVGVTMTPSIFIPIPWVTHNEQYHNAKVLEDLGLAKILSQGVLNPEILVQKIQKMINRVRQGKLQVDESRLRKIFVTDAAEKIADELEEFIEV